jgi:hypothetical protein
MEAAPSTRKVKRKMDFIRVCMSVMGAGVNDSCINQRPRTLIPRPIERNRKTEKVITPNPPT